MPYVYLYQCRECDFDVEIVGAREFYLDSSGQRHDYEYPEPGTYEWPIKRVAGLWSRLWQRAHWLITRSSSCDIKKAAGWRRWFTCFTSARQSAKIFGSVYFARQRW